MSSHYKSCWGGSASIGIAISPEHDSTEDDLYKSAETALYAAKRGGRDTWRRFEIDRV